MCSPNASERACLPGAETLRALYAPNGIRTRAATLKGW